jgi:hypothetical protein
LKDRPAPSRYDPSLSLVIDPVLSFSVYQGGTGLDRPMMPSMLQATLHNRNHGIRELSTVVPGGRLTNDNRKNAFVMKLIHRERLFLFDLLGER